MKSEERERDGSLDGERVRLQPRRHAVLAKAPRPRRTRLRMSTHSSIEPSWFPQTPVIL